MSSPFERSKAELESQGFHVWKTERPASMFYPTLDLFNLMDLVAIRDDRRGVMGVQVCGEDVAPHIHKIMEGYTKKKIKKGEMVEEVIPPNPYIKTWLIAGNTFFIWAWRLRKNEGKKASFQLREIEFILESGQVVHREIIREEDNT
jgi:hypothetical protein